MNVDIVGAGPGGLYAGMLLKKSSTDWDVTVHERNAPGESYGWGIVFSDSALRSLREADPETHEKIRDTFVHWNPINVYHRGELHRCDGHAFAGMMRHELLDILRDGCRRYGVELNYESPVEDPTELAEATDLLIGADGLRSGTRDAFAEHFQPRLESGTINFAWYGTEKPFDAFSFIIKENADGLWQVHTYPGEKNTIVVECNDETFESAGFDEAASEDETIDYLEELLANHLAGHDILSKEHRWRKFTLVRNRSWHHDNIVIIGDAAHTVHYTIGAGTQMAMKDAIALAEGFREQGADIEAALQWYEQERRPSVEAMQEASRWSQDYFENVDTFTYFEPEQFTFHLLTRSTISYDNLKIRDSSYVDEFNRWFATEGSDRAVPPSVTPPPMFGPFELGVTTLPNRAVLTPGLTFDAQDGLSDTAHLDEFVQLGLSDPGLVLTDPLAIMPRGRITPGSPGLYDDDHRQVWSDAVDRIHDASTAKVGARLMHAGRRGATQRRTANAPDRPLANGEGWELIAPSSIPYLQSSRTPRAMQAEDFESVKDWFVRSAELAHTAGFDLLSLHAGHGYLLSSFLSPLTNEREDEYGGSLEGRLRYPLEIVDAVCETWPEEKPLAVTLGVTDWQPGGLTLDESFEGARELANHGVDLLAIVAGQTTPYDRPEFDPRTLAQYSEWVRNEARVPTLSTNFATTDDEINTLIASGRADLSLLHRSAL